MPLEQIDKALDYHFNHCDIADMRIAAMLNQHANAGWTAELCSELARDPVLADEIAARSYQHGNGFHKIVLLEKGYKLRLHVWLPGSACEENIHDHRWSFASAVITGQLRSEIWSDSALAGESNAFEHVYHASSAENPAYTVYKGPCRIERVKQSIRHAGDYYSMPSGSMHRISHHGNRLVATLMCSAHGTRGSTRLISENPDLTPMSNPPRMNRRQLLDVLSTLTHQAY